MEASESTQSASRETCLGLPFVEERPISEEERAGLQREARQSLGRSCAWGCLAPFVLLVFLCIFATIVPSNNNATVLQILPCMVVMILGLAAGATFFLLANDRYKLRKVAKVDLRKGNIKRYQGFAPGIDEDNIPEPEVQSKSSAKIAGVDVSVFEPIFLEVFSASRRLYRVNGEIPQGLHLIPEEHTAFQPEQAQIAAKWAKPAPIIAENTIDVSESGQRELSLEEVKEIDRHVRTTWRKPIFPAILSTAYFIGLFIALMLNPSNVEWTAYIYAPFAFFIDYQFAKVVRRSWLLSKDAKYGLTIITRTPDRMDGHKISEKSSVIEWLPCSKNFWTINGEPAQWRLRG